MILHRKFGQTLPFKELLRLSVFPSKLCKVFSSVGSLSLSVCLSVPAQWKILPENVQWQSSADTRGLLLLDVAGGSWWGYKQVVCSVSFIYSQLLYQTVKTTQWWRKGLVVKTPEENWEGEYFHPIEEFLHVSALNASHTLSTIKYNRCSNGNLTWEAGQPGCKLT